MKQRSRKSDNSGVAMIVVLIVSAVVLVFCLSLLLVTYTLFAQTSRQTTQFQCKLLAQSCSEMLGEELDNPDSELSDYLEEQIQNGYWVSAGTQQSEEEGSAGMDAVSELVLNMDDDGSLGDYNVTVTLTYSLNSADDDGTDDGDDDDDQDDRSSDNQSGNETGVEAESAATENNTYSIKASIRCMRGDGTDWDTQLYTIETVYPAVSFYCE